MRFVSCRIACQTDLTHNGSTDDGQGSTSGKRGRVEIKSSHEELADDLDDSDSEDGMSIAEILARDKLKTEQTAAAAAPVAAAVGMDGGGWVSSDDIDFGEYVVLDEEDEGDEDDGDEDDGVEEG